MVTVGDTDRDPLVLTVPIPWSMDTVVAFVDVHVRVDEEPSEILDGFALNDTEGVLPTDTVTLSVILPDELLAVSIYVVVTVGDTERDPLLALTSPTLWSITADVAPLIFQLNVELPPSTIDVGLAPNEFITGWLPTVTVAVSLAEPLPFVAVIV